MEILEEQKRYCLLWQLYFSFFFSTLLHFVNILINFFTFCPPESALLCYFA